MKYYYFTGPYFALIREDSEEAAFNMYEREVADNIDGEFWEMGRDYASIYSNAFQPEGLEGLHVVGGDSDA